MARRKQRRRGKALGFRALKPATKSSSSTTSDSQSAPSAASADSQSSGD